MKNLHYFRLAVILQVFAFSLYAQIVIGPPVSGKIKNANIQTRTKYMYLLEKPDEPGFKCEKRYFDKEGNDTLVELFSITDKKVFSKNVKKYDTRGKVIEAINLRAVNLPETEQAENDQFNEYEIKEGAGLFEFYGKTLFEYNDSIHSSKSYDFDAKGELLSSFKSRYICRPDGKITEMEEFYGDSTLYRKVVYSYDEKGNKVKFCNYGLKGNLLSFTDYYYDSVGNPVNQNSYKPDGTLTGRSFYKIDTNGNKSETLDFDADSSLKVKNLFSYDKNNNMTEIIREPAKPGIPYTRFSITYDKFGNILTNIKFDKNAKPYRFELYIYSFY